MGRVRRAASAWAAALLLASATDAAAQYTPTPPLPESIDPAAGGNVGCERAYGEQACNGGRGVVRRPGPKADVWGALAATRGAMAWGVSWNFRSEQAAKADALRRCHAAPGGKTGCQVIATVADACLALVTSAPEGVVKVGGPIGALNYAEGNGRLQCQRSGGGNCRVATSFCADGQRHVLRGYTEFSNGNPVFAPDSGAPLGRARR